MIGLLKGLKATMGHLFTKKVTVQYPEERRELPERSRGLIGLRLKEGSQDPRCISCTFCEQICPAIAIKVDYRHKQPEKAWIFDAGAGPMYSCFNHGDQAVGMEPWPEGENAVAAPERSDSCLAAALADAPELTPAALTKTARREGVWLSQLFGIATFYDQLRPGAPRLEPLAATPEAKSAMAGNPTVLVTPGIDPQDIDSYLAADGYQGLARALEMEPAAIIESIASSGLRGRGGAGFATARKWQLAAATAAEHKYLICNAHDGEPDSYKDRYLLEHNPQRVIEGMIIAARAIGASRGIIYLGADNALALSRLESALAQAQERGYLAASPEAGFAIAVAAVPEAYAAGEETMLIASLEGKRPMPQARPPYPAQSGLQGRPTVIQNVETLACVPWIIAHGAGAFKAIGGGNVPGTKLFTLQGAVAQPGLYEAPANISLKKLVDQAGGGFKGEAKAALVGGTVGGLLPLGLFDIPLDFDSMREAGADLSSGVIEVLGADNCLVDTIRERLAFASREACGKCVPGRVGTRRLLDIVERICGGRALAADLELAADLAVDIQDAALCHLCREAVKPLLSGLKFFPNEFEEHVRGRSCGAGKCVMQ